MEMIKVTPNKEKVKSILKMTTLIEERIKTQDRERMTALIITDYYEIIKELITALLLTKGHKTLSHKDLIDYLKERHKEFDEKEISVLDGLRVLRNRVAYEGFFVNPSYLGRNESLFKTIILKIKGLIKKSL